MILAAGLGSRLAPFTDDTPKPLLPFFDVPLIEYGIRRLVDAGLREIVVNTWHCGEALEGFLEALPARLGPAVRIRLSREEVLLGTGGGIARARPFFEGRRLLVVNSDLFYRFDLAKLNRFHEARGAVATVLLHSGEGHEHLRSTATDGEGRLTDIGLRHLPAGARCLPAVGAGAVVGGDHRVQAAHGGGATGLRPGADLSVV
jgi:NDP-sugar pyrophosphorylase family protein